MVYKIQARDSTGQWDDSLVGNDTEANTFDTVAEAEAMIPELRKLGEDWADGEYRIAERNCKMRTYKIAFQMESGAWDVVEEFEARNNVSANHYAERNYEGQEWYILKDGENING